MRGLSIVITDFNGFEQTRKCLNALRHSHYQGFTVLVVDHGTSDKTRKGLETEFPEVDRISGSAELWWTGAVNLGVKAALAAGASAVMLLNNDCYIKPNSIERLLDHARKSPRAIVAPIQRDMQTGKTGAFNSDTCFLLGFATLRLPEMFAKRLTDSPLIRVKLIVGGRGVIVPADVFRKVGLFDEANLPHYGADHDFYLRVRKEKIPMYVATDAVVDVDGTRTSMAHRPGELSWREFVGTLHSRGSHRNLADIASLFKKHYPVRRLYLVGVILAAARYSLVYAVKRFAHLLKSVYRSGSVSK